MKKSLIKNNLISIHRTRRRFLSILVMAFLGVGFYSGLVATGPDILDSLDRYIKSSNLYDISIVSTLGLTDEDIEVISNMEEIESAYGIQTKDSIVDFNGKESVCKVIEYNENINEPVLKEGRLPIDSSECLLDEKYVINGDTSQYIGKKIVLQNDDKDDENNDIFTKKEFEIVGIVESPIYISSERGNTAIGSGNLSFFIYTKSDVINLDYYTEISATVKGSKEITTNSEEYLNLINPVIEKIENIKQERENVRYNGLINEANSKLNEKQKEFDNNKEEAISKLEDAEKQITSAKKQITENEKNINKSELELESKEKEGKQKFENAEKDISTVEKQLLEQETNLKIEKQKYIESKEEITGMITQMESKILDINKTIQSLEEQKNIMINQGMDTSDIDKNINQAKYQVEELENQKVQLEKTIVEAENQITLGEQQIEQAKTELEKQKLTLTNSKIEVNTQIKKARQEIQKGKQQLEEAKLEIEQKEKEYIKAKEETEKNLNEAENKLNEAGDEVNKIEKAKWYIQDRLDNTGYTNIFDAIKTMDNIAKMFPIIFYVVAVLISLTSMTRMIEEERIEIGTLKALGYTKLQIISKYILYSLLACIIGGFLGMTIGLYLLPNIVWMLYSILYTIPQFYCSYRIGIGLVGIVISFICIGGATILVAYKELKQMPSVLMRPKPPKSGKRIVLEKFTSFWKKLNFSQKVTIRNIFRYKKRALMTIIGIAGCTGLMLTGFGIKDSIVDIPAVQFGEIFTYESSISLFNTNGLEEIKNYLENNANVQDYVQIDAATGSVTNDNENYSVTVFVPEDKEKLSKACNLTDAYNKEKIELNDNGVVITDKIAEMFDIKVGDEITFVDSEDIRYNLKVEKIAKNYVGHYIYMSKEFYEANIKTYKTNMIYVNTNQISDDEQNKISEDILNIDGVASISIIENLMKSVDDMLSTINYVVIILIVSSALLAFVVLYNLANINIGERQREIATLKVLGFHDKEVDNYINKENIIFTVIGIAIGLIFGTFLTNGIISSIEIDKLKFMKKILISSYIYSSAITAVFSIIVNSIIHFILKKIDMIESLKSVE